MIFDNGWLSPEQLQELYNEMDVLTEKGMVEEARVLLERLKRMQIWSNFMAKESERAWKDKEEKAEYYQKMVKSLKKSALIRKAEAEQITMKIQQYEHCMA